MLDQICPERVFPVGNGKIAVVHTSIVVCYDIKLFRTGGDRRNGILMFFFLLVAETKMTFGELFNILAVINYSSSL